MHRPLPDDVTQARWLIGSNDSGSEIPAFSLVKVTATDAQGRFEVEQPTVDGEAVYVVGSLPIPAADSDGDGIGAITGDWPVWAKYDSGDGTPAIGETWGAESGTWKLKKNQPGFRIVGDPDTTDEIVQVESVSTGGGGINYYRNNAGPTDVYTLTAASQVLTVPIGIYLVTATMNVSFAGGAATVQFGIGVCNEGATPSSPKIDTTPARTDGASGAFVTVTLVHIVEPEE